MLAKEQVSQVETLLPIDKSARILDLCCGVGSLGGIKYDQDAQRLVVGRK